MEKFELKFKRGDKKAFLKKLFDLPLSKGITSGSLVGLLEGFFQAVAVPQLDPENKFEDALCPVIVNLASTNDQVLSKDTLGGYNVEDKEIFILDRRDIDGSDLPLSIASMFGTLAHEYRHHIQHIKGSKQAEEMFWKLYGKKRPDEPILVDTLEIGDKISVMEKALVHGYIYQTPANRDRLSEWEGYICNPYEVDARKFTQACLNNYVSSILKSEKHSLEENLRPMELALSAMSPCIENIEETLDRQEVIEREGLFNGG